MITKDEILNYVKLLDGAYCDTPFKNDFYSTVLRRKKRGGNVWFGIIIYATVNYFKRYGAPVPEDKSVLCLKCPPDLQPFLITSYTGKILPAYHMNKTHWISIVMSSDVPEEDIKKLISLSYDITGGGKENK